jgi:ribonuclease-3
MRTGNLNNEDNVGQEIRLLAERLDFPLDQISLLMQALTHPTFFEGMKPEKGGDNQRLEFLGDAVLDLLVGEYLYLHYPYTHEGDLTKMRSVIVCEASLAAKAVDLGLGEALRMGRGAAAAGDSGRPSVLADAFEAVLGAVFVAKGLDAARKFITGQFGSVMDKLRKEDYEDKKSLLQELIQRELSCGVQYKLLAAEGPDHAPIFVSAVYCGKKMIGQGKGGSKKESEVQAAAEALARRKEWLR